MSHSLPPASCLLSTDFCPLMPYDIDLITYVSGVIIEAMKTITPSKLREDIYRILDKVLETGVPVEITRKGRRLKISSEEPANKLANLKKRPYLKCDPEEIVHMDWSKEWKSHDLP